MLNPQSILQTLTFQCSQDTSKTMHIAFLGNGKTPHSKAQQEVRCAITRWELSLSKAVCTQVDCT